MNDAMNDRWTAVETLPQLGEDEAQIWRVELSEEIIPSEDYAHLLTGEELSRAQRLRTGRVRSQFVMGRAVLRTLLGDCLSLAPQEVVVTQTSFGKPETARMFFNVAHSGATILIALCRSRRVGIDVEYVSREVEALEIAKSSFTAAEYGALASIGDPDEQRRAFFACWTRKEAVIKADGRGLSLPLDSFEVPVRDADVRQFVVSVNDEATVAKYALSDLACGADRAAAFAIWARHCTVNGFLFPLGIVPRKG